MRPIFHQLGLSLALGDCDLQWIDWGSHWVNWGFVLGPRGFFRTNMLVFSIRNGRFGGLNQREGPTRVVLRFSGI